MDVSLRSLALAGSQDSGLFLWLWSVEIEELDSTLWKGCCWKKIESRVLTGVTVDK